MKIIIVGGGKVGELLCAELESEKNDIVLIDQEERTLERVLNRFDITGIVGDGVRAEVQAEADVAHADVFIAATDRDEVNLIAAVLAKKAGAQHTVARVRNPEYADQIAVLRESLGISMLINPERAAAREIARSIKYPAALSVETLAGNRVNLVELEVKPEGPLCDLSLRDFRNRFGSMLVCVMRRGDHIFIPSGENFLRAGDRVYVTGTIGDVGNFYRTTGLRRKEIRTLLVVGGGRITFYLLQALQHSRVAVTVIEHDLKKCEELSVAFPDAHIVHGDGTDQDVLTEQHIEQFDAFVSLTGVDEENLFLSIFAAQFGICKIMTKMSRTAILKLVNNDALRSIITPKRLAASEIIQFVCGRANARGSHVEALYRIADDTVEVLQFHVKKDSKVCGRPLAEMPTKKELLIAYIIRDEELIFPGGQDRLEAEDRVIVVTREKGLNNLDDILAHKG